MSRAVFASINAQGVSDPPGVVLDNVRAVLGGVTAAGLQEVAPLRGPHRLREGLSRRAVGVHHDVRTGSRAGSAVVWSKTAARARSRGLRLLAEAEPGDDLRDRYLAWVLLVLPGLGPLVFGSAHRPLRATGDQPEFDAALARFLRACAFPAVIAMDANARTWPPTGHAAAAAAGWRWVGVGIDGFIVSPGLRVGEAFRFPATRSDHRPVGVVVRW